MYITGPKIKEMISGKDSDCRLTNADPSRVGTMSYDLRTDYFYDGKEEKTKTDLNPGDSIFVISKEKVNLGDTLSCKVLVRNKWLRKGLSVDSPLYFPGHSSNLIFRITNMSAEKLSLDAENGIAQVVFENVDDVEKPYGGGYKGEIDLRDIGNYHVQSARLQEIDQKIEDLKGLEKSIYTNMLALLAVFVAIFNIGSEAHEVIAEGAGPSSLAAILLLCGAFAFLFVLIVYLREQDGEKKDREEKGGKKRLTVGLIMGIAACLIILSAVIILFVSLYDHISQALRLIVSFAA